MKISTRARYGLRMMLELALHYGQGALLLKKIARNQEISEKYLGQLTIPLKAKGLIISERGAKGGYQLSRPPAKIKLAEIFEVLEGPLNLLDCLKNSASCKRSAGCVTRLVWDKLNSQIFQILNSLSLENLVKMQKSKNKKINFYEI